MRSAGSLGSVVSLRLPGDLEIRLKEEAEQQGLSLSAYIRVLLEGHNGGLQGLGQSDGYSRGFEEGLRAASSKAQTAVTAAIHKLYPR